MIEIKILNKTLADSNATWHVRETHVSQLTDDAFRRMLGAKPHPAILSLMAGRPAAPGAAAVFSPLVDWRDKGGNHVSPVRDQGGCGSCVSFACVALCESMLHLEKSIWADLSEADSHFCSSHGTDCEGWWPDLCLNEFRTRGVVGEADFPYKQAFPRNDPWSGPPVCRVVPNRPERIHRIDHVVALNDPVSAKVHLDAHGPIVGCFTVFEDFRHYGGGVYRHASGHAVGGHCVEIIGYSEKEQCWICKNSWGDTWGEKGFFRMHYADFLFNSSFFPCYGASGVKAPGQV